MPTPHSDSPTRAAAVIVTPAGPDDAGEILTVQRAAYVTEAQLYGEPSLPPLTETLDEVRGVLAGDGIVLAARHGTRIVGAVRARLEDAAGHIGRLAVAPDFQGRGVGSGLLRAVEAACPARVRRFELFTGARSEANLRLYRRHGYVVFAHRPLDAGPGLIYLEKHRSTQATPAQPS